MPKTCNPDVLAFSVNRSTAAGDVADMLAEVREVFASDDQALAGRLQDCEIGLRDGGIPVLHPVETRVDMETTARVLRFVEEDR